jgi:hypothetical protein
MLELHNLDYSEDIKINANSTYNIRAIFIKVALNREARNVARSIIESSMDVNITTSHSAKDSTVDIISLSNKIFSDGLVT